MTKEPRGARELTLRGLCLGALITVVFMSANLYLGLKTGITFSSSIPAVVISMSLLKLVGGGDILENNIVQTQASAAGTLCNINLVLPALVLIHYWIGFPLWQTMAICVLGGLLGVAVSVPLRRVMVVDSNLPFPEGVAAAEVLTSAHSEHGHGMGDAGGGGIRDLGLSALVAGVFSLATSGTRLLADKIGGTVVLGHSVFRFDVGLSLALIGIGYLVRLGCCLALLIGIAIAWGVAVPILGSAAGGGDPAAAAEAVWAAKVRLIGAGLIAVAGLWTVGSLVRPVIGTIRSGLNASTRKPDTVARDIPIVWVGASLAVLTVPVAALFWAFVSGSKAHVSMAVLVPALTAVTAILAILMATGCGYLAGLLGSSSSPISGIAILTVMLVIGCAVAALPNSTSQDTQFIGGLSLFVTSIIITASSIANDNLQDLKAGYIVGATPWKQQVALAIGVVLGAVVIAPVLQLLYEAYGFVGALPREGMNADQAMPAPQAALLAQVADGIIHHRLDWTMVAIGGGLGALFVALESALQRRGFTLPALSVGIGIYLPCTVVLTIAAGGIIGWLAEHAASRRQVQIDLRRRGVLLSSGFLVGESLVGIVVALADILRGKSGMLTIYVGDGSSIRSALSIILFAVPVLAFYKATSGCRLRRRPFVKDA